MLAGLALVRLEGDPHYWDADIYQGYGEQITHGHVPYRDFSLEYPPGALVSFVLPALVTSTTNAYDGKFQGLMVIMLALASALVVLSLALLRASTGRIALSLAAMWGGTLLLGPFVSSRFDLYAAALTLAATCAILYRRRYVGPVLLGISASTKLYAAVLIPLLVIRTWRSDGRRAALRDLGVSVGTAVLVYFPFFVLSPHGVAHSVWRQLGRGLQIESLGSGVLLAFHHLLGMNLGWTNSGGSQNLTGTVASVGSTVTTILGAAALLLVWWRFWRGDAASDERFVRYAAAAIAAFVAFGKVLSPQFLVWLLLSVVLVTGRRGIFAMAFLVAACAMTRVWFPWHYRELVTTFDPRLSWSVLFRDLALVGIFVSLVAWRPALPLPARNQGRQRTPTIATLRTRSVRR